MKQLGLQQSKIGRLSLDDALKQSELPQQHAVLISKDLAYWMLQECMNRKNLESGRRVQSLIVNSALESVVILANHIIRLFASCGSLIEANQAFNNVLKPDEYTWNAVIDSYAKFGEGDIALQLYSRMQHGGSKPDRCTFFSILKACRSIGTMEYGRYIHQEFINTGLQYDITVGNTLIDVYAKGSNLEEALRVFKNLAICNVVAWSTMIAGYSNNGDDHLALQCYASMQDQGIQPDKVTFVQVLRACRCITNVNQGRYIHRKIIQSGLQSDVVVASTLIDMYAKCGYLEEASIVFNNLPNPNVVTWSAIIAVYAKQAEDSIGLECYEKMQHSGIETDKVALLSILKACGVMRILSQGRQLHEKIMSIGLHFDIVIASTVIDMYAKCEGLQEARNVFESMPVRNVVSWGAMIAGYAAHGDGHLALQCYQNMQHAGVEPSKVTVLCVLKACTSITAIEHGRHIHEHIISYMFEHEIMIGSTLVDMYAKCGSFNEAQRVFDRLPNRNVVSWSSMIAGYAQYGNRTLALECFQNMLDYGMEPGIITFSNALKACGSMSFKEWGRFIHTVIIDRGLIGDMVIGSTLVDMYAKCSSLDEACKVFNKMPNKDLVLWDTMVAGYAENGEDWLALECYENMQYHGIRPDKVTFMNILRVCARIGAIKQGRHVHKEISENSFQFDIVVGSTLIDMYAKCGSSQEAHNVFDSLPKWDIVLWGAMVSAYSQLGEAGLSVQCFEDMLHGGGKPDEAVFSTILTALSRTGLVEEALCYIGTMSKCHALEPDIYQVTCIIDLLGRAGLFVDAEVFFLTVTVQPDLCLWTTLLSACRLHGNVELGRQCFNAIVKLDSLYAPAYVLMANIYASAHMTEDAYRLENMRKCAGLGTHGGCRD